MSVILSDEIIAEYWKELFDRNNYSFNNSTFSNRESSKKSVWIPYSDIESVSEEFAAYLMSYPERILSLGRETLRSTAETDEEMCIRVTGLPDNCLREMDGIDSGNSDFISVKGIVTKFEPLNIKKNNGIKTILSETQTVVISDNPKGLRAMELRLGGDLLGTEICGKTLIFNGFYRDNDFSDDSGAIIVSRHFEVNSIGTADSPFDIAFSEEDIKEIQKASEDPLFFDNLMKSIAPTIAGIDHIKMSLALQLFGGVKHIVDDGTCISGNICILLLADSDTVVSELIDTMNRLSPKSILLRGDGNDSLPFSSRLSDTDSEKTVPYIRVGAVTVASGGHLCVKDLKSLDVKIFGTLHEVADQLKNTLVYEDNMGYHVVCLPADVSLLCAALSEKERIETGSPICDRFGLHSGILCKFEPIFVLKDDQVNSPKKDEVFAEGDEKPTYDEEFIRKYVAYARLNCKPELSEENARIIIDHYMNLRNKVKYMAVRQLETLLRLAEASAKSRLSGTVDFCDIKRSFDVFDYYLMSVGVAMKEESSSNSDEGCDRE